MYVHFSASHALSLWTLSHFLLCSLTHSLSTASAFHWSPANISSFHFCSPSSSPPPSILLTPGRQAVIHACNYGQTVLLLNRCEICIAQCVCVCSCVHPLSLLCSISSVLDTPQASCCLTSAIPFCFQISHTLLQRSYLPCHTFILIFSSQRSYLSHALGRNNSRQLTLISSPAPQFPFSLSL